MDGRGGYTSFLAVLCTHVYFVLVGIEPWALCSLVLYYWAMSLDMEEHIETDAES